MGLIGPGEVVPAVRRIRLRQGDDLCLGSEDCGAACLILTHPLPLLYTGRGYPARTQRGLVQAAADLGILEYEKGLDNMGASQPMDKDRRYDVVIIVDVQADLTSVLHCSSTAHRTGIQE